MQASIFPSGKAIGELAIVQARTPAARGQPVVEVAHQVFRPAHRKGDGRADPVARPQRRYLLNDLQVLRILLDHECRLRC